jgi:hypothetical protein
MTHYVLFTYVIALGIETGAGLFTSAVVFPAWTASPEAVIGWKPSMPYFMQEGDFFMFSSAATTALALAVLFMSRRLAPNVRPWARWSAAIFIIVAIVTALYYVPVQFVMQGDAGATLPRAELAAMLGRFVALNWVRQLFMAGALVAGVHALGLSYRSTGGDPALPAASRS